MLTSCVHCWFSTLLSWWTCRVAMFLPSRHHGPVTIYHFNHILTLQARGCTNVFHQGHYLGHTGEEDSYRGGRVTLGRRKVTGEGGSHWEGGGSHWGGGRLQGREGHTGEEEGYRGGKVTLTHFYNIPTSSQSCRTRSILIPSNHNSVPHWDPAPILVNSSQLHYAS